MVALEEAIITIKKKIHPVPVIAVTLGSGLGSFADNISNRVSIPYGSIPGYPVSTVAGHAGRLISGTIGGVALIALQGRAHFYEGYSFEEVTFPVRLLNELGIRTLILTNASGSVNPEYQPGEFMLIRDFINFTQMDPGDIPVPDGSQLFSDDIQNIFRASAGKASVTLHSGVYAWTLGPSYETPAEVHAISHLGGDVVGMSTLPEALAAWKLGMEIAGLSCITNWAAGISPTPLSHDEVTLTAKKVEKIYSSLMTDVIVSIGNRTNTP